MTDREIVNAAQTAAVLFREFGWTWGKDERPVTEADLALLMKKFSGTEQVVFTGRILFQPIYDENADGDDEQIGVRVLVHVGTLSVERDPSL